ncbi:MAG: hypothetical protein NZ700_00895 [Gemmataceae bacterium]|nr:hypothetical protein [Gemmataceae bacterium]MDW8265217.1 hypothetical protein [Gemmataceae bacterium]
MRTSLALVAAAIIGAPLAAAADVAALLTQIKAVGREGAGNPQAAQAWRELAQQGSEALPAILAGLDDAHPIAANWLRCAVDTIAARELAAGRSLPAAALEAFVTDTRHAPRARRLAYEWLVRVDPTAPGRLLPGLADDPSTELRRDAVAVLIQNAEAIAAQGDKSAAVAAYRKALTSARDRDQVEAIAQALKKFDVTVDLAAHFGFITDWLLAAPFDNTNGIGFAAVYPPEKGVDVNATYVGKNGLKFGWKPTTTSDPFGKVDLNKVIGKYMGVVGYGFAAVHSPTEQRVEVRAGTKNAVKIFVNGQEVFFREEYHHGMRMDQHVAPCTLRKGRNEILIKVCQNEQKEPWAQEWEFQLRVCDAVGGAVPLRVLSEKTAAGSSEGRVMP